MRRRLLIPALVTIAYLLVAVTALAAPGAPAPGTGPAPARPAGSYHVTLPAAADTTLSSKQPDAVHFSPFNGYLGVGHTDGYMQSYGYMRILARFDLSSLPAGAEITAATLQLRVTSTGSYRADIPVTAYRITSPWEGSSASWNTMSGQAAESYATTTVPYNASSYTWIDWDVTPLVQLWLSGGAANNGVQLRTAEASPDGHAAYFAPRTWSSGGPRLMIDFTAPETPTPTPSRTETPTPTGTLVPTAAHRIALPITLLGEPPTPTEPTSTPTPPLGGAELVLNGGFEDSSAWVLTGGSYTRVYSHSSSRSMRVCDSLIDCTPGFYQSMAVPGEATSLTLRYYWVSLQPQASEYLRARIEAGGKVYFAPIHQNSYGQQFQAAQVELPAEVVAALRGQSVRLGFDHGGGDGNYPYATYYVDDVSLTWR